MRPALVQITTISTFPSSSPASNGFNTPMNFQAGGGGVGMGMRPQGLSLYSGMAAPNFGALTQNHTPMGQTSKAPDI